LAELSGTKTVQGLGLTPEGGDAKSQVYRLRFAIQQFENLTNDKRATANENTVLEKAKTCTGYC
jgi:hypothetical protein